MTTSNEKQALLDAIHSAGGTQGDLAEKLRGLGLPKTQKVRQQYISKWLTYGIPHSWVPLISKATGVPVERLKPSFFVAE